MTVNPDVFNEFNAAVERGDYVKVSELAKLINMRESLLYYHIDAGNLPSIRIGGSKGHIWIPVSALPAFREKYGK